MREEEIRNNAFGMPVHSPAYPRPPFRFINREYFIISYETEPDALGAVVVPQPLDVDSASSTTNSFGCRTPLDSATTRKADRSSPYWTKKAIEAISRTRCISMTRAGSRAAANLGFSEEARFAAFVRRRQGHAARHPRLRHAARRDGHDGLQVPSARHETERRELADTPNYLEGHSARRWLGTHLRIGALLSARRRRDRRVGGARALELHPHALASVADLPVRKVIGARHVIANLTLDIGEVVYDYLAPAEH